MTDAKLALSSRPTFEEQIAMADAFNAESQRLYAERHVHAALTIARKHKDDSQAMTDIVTLLDELTLAD